MTQQSAEQPADLPPPDQQPPIVVIPFPTVQIVQRCVMGIPTEILVQLSAPTPLDLTIIPASTEPADVFTLTTD